MKVKDLATKQSILLDVAVQDKQDCLKKLIQGLVADGAVTDAEAYLQSVNAREEHSSTGIGFQVAIPHGKSDAVVRSALAFARPAAPLDWNSIDGQPVKLVILLAIPGAQAGTEHLRLLANISKQLIHESFRNRLLEARSADEILEALDF